MQAEKFMTQIEQTKNAKDFSEYWKDKGAEKQETQRYWIGLLQEVLGVQNAQKVIEFEKRVKLTHTSFWKSQYWYSRKRP